MNNANLISKTIVNSVDIFNDSVAMNNNGMNKCFCKCY